jgi:hypothetical protein
MVCGAVVSSPPKHQVALKLLESSGIFVHLDPRHPEVVVPSQFKTQRELVLQFGLNMRIPIKDLEVDDGGISGTLSFSRRPFWCRIPWFAVHAIVSDVDRRGFSWGAAPVEAPPPPKRSHLRAVGPAEPEPTAPSANPSGEGRCKVCDIRWPEDVDSCPLCGSTRGEAFEGADRGPEPGETPSVSPTVESSSVVPREDEASDRAAEGPPDEPPPDTPTPPKRPFLRLVK